MLIRDHLAVEANSRFQIRKFVNGTDVSSLGAFPSGSKISFLVSAPRTFGCAAVVLRVAPDHADWFDLPLSFTSRSGDTDLYSLTLDTATLDPSAQGGLFFYEFLFLRGCDTLFSNSLNNLDFDLSSAAAERFRLLLYRPDFHTPAWFRGGTMYHIFLDRFRRGAGNAALRSGASLDPDWDHGIPQFAEKAGDPLSNNVFFGGNLWGVVEKLDYLSSLGVTVLYLSPVFESASNHRYDTADYEKIDALLGGSEAFDLLIREAHARGIRVILDGVFNHTGDDSVYFNRYGNYPSVGAAQSQNSPYFGWYGFRSFPDRYDCWWGIEILPRLHQENPDCRRFFTGNGGIAEKWLRRGADGWRLDVADELCDEFLDDLRRTVKETTGGDGILIGEVWENAADKISYGKRRRYLTGGQLDSVMNYPFRNAILALLVHRDVETFYHILTELYASYPPEVSHSLMNLLGTHDTERILTLLGDPTGGDGKTNAELASARLSPAARTRALKLLKIASVLQFTVYGVPSVYYGDEAGMEGYHDPFCRLPYPWGREDHALIEHYRQLGALRKAHPALANGDFRFLSHDDRSFSFERILRRGDSKITPANGDMTDCAISDRMDCVTGNATGGAICGIPADTTDEIIDRVRVAVNLSRAPVTLSGFRSPVPPCGYVIEEG